jgi:hypothetical protein
MGEIIAGFGWKSKFRQVTDAGCGNGVVFGIHEC